MSSLGSLLSIFFQPLPLSFAVLFSLFFVFARQPPLSCFVSLPAALSCLVSLAVVHSLSRQALAVFFPSAAKWSLFLNVTTSLLCSRHQNLPFWFSPQALVGSLPVAVLILQPSPPSVISLPLSQS